VEILKNCGLTPMAWAVLPAILGERYLHDHGRVLEKLVDAVARRNRKEFLLAHLEAMHRYPQPEHYAGKISQPCLIIVGAQDPLVSQKETKRLADLCRGTREIIPDTGHSVPLEVPELFNQMAAQFFIVI
jgi:pimeloyl-ACP methyl ester carboxylesterase